MARSVNEFTFAPTLAISIHRVLPATRRSTMNPVAPPAPVQLTLASPGALRMLLIVMGAGVMVELETARILSAAS